MNDSAAISLRFAKLNFEVVSTWKLLSVYIRVYLRFIRRPSTAVKLAIAGSTATRPRLTRTDLIPQVAGRDPGTWGGLPDTREHRGSFALGASRATGRSSPFLFAYRPAIIPSCIPSALRGLPLSLSLFLSPSLVLRLCLPTHGCRSLAILVLVLGSSLSGSRHERRRHGPGN